MFTTTRLTMLPATCCWSLAGTGATTSRAPNRSRECGNRRPRFGCSQAAPSRSKPLCLKDIFQHGDLV